MERILRVWCLVGVLVLLGGFTSSASAWVSVSVDVSPDPFYEGDSIGVHVYGAWDAYWYGWWIQETDAEVEVYGGDGFYGYGYQPGYATGGGSWSFNDDYARGVGGDVSYSAYVTVYYLDLETYNTYSDYDYGQRTARFGGLLLPPPSGEYSWGANWADMAALFGAVLQGGYSWAGLHVYEQDGGGGVDGCFNAAPDSPFHFPGTPGYNAISPGTIGRWPVGNQNSYGYDYIGFVYSDPILWYRNHGAAPCEIVLNQDMFIELPVGGDQLYKTNVLKIGITNLSIYASRDGVEQERVFP